MKKFLKTLAVIAAVEALGFGFASCSDDDDGGSGPSALAAFTYTTMTDGTTETETIYFYENNTWESYNRYDGYTDKDYSGTYAITSGDFTNGTLNFTLVVHEEEKLGWKPVSLKIKEGIFYLYIHDSTTIVDVNDENLDKYVKQ